MTILRARSLSSLLKRKCNFGSHSKLAFRSLSNGAGSEEYLTRRASFDKEIEGLPEFRSVSVLKDFLRAKIQGENSVDNIAAPIPPANGYKHEMTNEQVMVALDAALTTFSLHIESRIAALTGRGFYTIGPCGEEALSSAGLCLRKQDSLALHYRHLGINLARNLSYSEDEKALERMIMDRARGYTVSRQDPVTGGVHCSIGSDPTPEDVATGAGDFIVTSTLASQCPSAVGRALGYSLTDLPPESRRARPISMVTLGDGSVHNHHFWSSFHLARHARHKKIKCPVLFGISDNGLSISYRTGGYVDTLFDHDPLVPTFRANGNDMLDVYSQTMAATQYLRKQSAPAVILYKGLVRRFGHAATDRQAAYLDMEEIQSRADTDLLESTIVQAVEVLGVTSYAQVYDRLEEIQAMALHAFAAASAEEKINRQDMLEVVEAPSIAVPKLPESIVNITPDSVAPEGRKEVMRKHMTRVIGEVMKEDESVIYLGEDVIHGGYYLVTENLAKEFPGRVLDFPPDETSLLGAAMGFSQVGLVPIIEIPYGKYLDCGADMFYEIAIGHWLSAGKRPNGMIIRLQGFDRGVFGGNFHTTNLLQHIPPGMDVVCYSNGEDYARGFRNAIKQAKAGRVVMSVDCTNLLNMRHLHQEDRDRGWERVYPPADEESALMGFDEVRRYGSKGTSCIVTYGNGVLTALQARRELVANGIISSEEDLDIIDSPYLNDVPDGLRRLMGTNSQYSSVLFADICKNGPGGSVLSSTVCSLRQQDMLPEKWDIVCAPRTYNPLGNMTTFLNQEDIVDAIIKLNCKDSTPGSNMVA